MPEYLAIVADLWIALLLAASILASFWLVSALDRLKENKT